jgi:glutaredoxin 2
MSEILMFYGRQCPDTTRAMLFVKKSGADVKKIEVWNDPKNKKIREKYYPLLYKECGAVNIVPAFIDKKNNRALCDPKTYEDFISWLENRPRSRNPKKNNNS